MKKAILIFLTVLIVGCAPIGTGLVKGRQYHASYVTFTTMKVGKVSVFIPQTHPERYELYLEIDGGKVVGCDVSKDMYNTVGDGEYYDCKNQHVVIKKNGNVGVNTPTP